MADFIHSVGDCAVFNYAQWQNAPEQGDGIYAVYCSDDFEYVVELSVLWHAYGWLGDDLCGGTGWGGVLDGDCVQTNQPGGIISGVAVCCVADIRSVFKWYDFNFELMKKSRKCGIKFLES